MKTKKYYIISALFLLAATLPPVTLAAVDALPTEWARADVSQAVSLGLVPEDLQSSYTQAVTRAEFCALAAALYEAETGITIAERSTFSDTNETNVEKMAAVGVVNGTSPGVFTPNTALTREQAATMLARLAGAFGKPLPEVEATFADKSSVSGWAYEAVGQVQAAGVMNGTSPDMFMPKGPYTREQSIVTMLRMYNAAAKTVKANPVVTITMEEGV